MEQFTPLQLSVQPFGLIVTTNGINTSWGKNRVALYFDSASVDKLLVGIESHVNSVSVRCLLTVSFLQHVFIQYSTNSVYIESASSKLLFNYSTYDHDSW